MRIIYATHGLPHGRRNGGEIASMNFVDALEALGHEVCVVGYTRRGTLTPTCENVCDAGPWPIEITDAGWRRYLWVLRSLVSGRPVINTKFVSRAYVRALRAARVAQADLLITDHTHMGWILDMVELPQKRIFIAHNVETNLYSDVSKQSRSILAKWIYRREGKLLEMVERALVDGHSQTWCLSNSDREALTSLTAHTAEIRVFDLPGQILQKPDVLPKVRYDIGMIGSWDWEINRKGIVWFLTQVMPHLPDDLTVAIAGSGSEALDTIDPRIIALGRVPDAGVFMQQCKALAVPTVVGSGIQLKTIEGISTGIPLVATPLAMRGIENAPEYVRVAETAEGFANALVAAKSSPHVLRDCGQNWAEDRRNRFEADVAKYIELLVHRDTRK